MKSESELSEQETHVEKRTKKIIVPPKSKRPNFFIKKLKLKGKTYPLKTETEANPDILSSSQSFPIERQTPEGGDNLMISHKSVFDKNLAETTRKINDSFTKNPTNCETVSLKEHTESSENLKDMPAYGDLIIDSATMSPSNKPATKRKDHLYKIIVIGDLGCGKTSIIKRYVHRFFTQSYQATVGVDFALKVLNWDENTLIRLQLWDIAGQERYNNMTRVYYKEAVGAFIVFDVSRINTFESVAKWKSDLDSKVQLPDGSPIPCVLLANKCDQQAEGIVTNPNKVNEYCKENGFTAWFETSAKENINIDEAAKALVAKILELDFLLNIDANKDVDTFSLAKEPETKHNCKIC